MPWVAGLLRSLGLPADGLLRVCVAVLAVQVLALLAHQQRLDNAFAGVLQSFQEFHRARKQEAEGGMEGSRREAWNCWWRRSTARTRRSAPPATAISSVSPDRTSARHRKRGVPGSVRDPAQVQPSLRETLGNDLPPLALSTGMVDDSRPLPARGH